jgi:subtilisin family serine protease
MAADQWSHRPAFGDTEGAWAIVPDAAASKVVVAVLDSGLDETHPEFAGRVASGGLNTLFDPPSADISDDNGHGTHCAGIVAAANDQAGVRGVAPGAQILPVKVLDQQGAGTDLGILQGIMAAIAWLPTPDDGSRVRVLSLSLGAALEDVSALYAQAFAIARRRGIVVVAASGNESLDFVGSPANAPPAIAVGSTSRYLGWERLSGFSNGGHALALVAPGAAILSTYPRTLGDLSGYAVESGTSMATPFVAGVAAQLVARYDPGNTRLDAAWTDLVRTRLLAAVDDLGPPGRDDLHGEGRANAHLAVYPQTLEGPVIQPTPAPPP